jgi:Apea-like HEPN
MTATIADEVRAWLEAERDAFVSAANALGCPLTVPHAVTVAEPQGNGAMYMQRVDSISVANHVVARMRIFDTMRRTGDRVAQAIVDSFGGQCAFAEHRAGFERDPMQWVYGALLLPLRLEYLRSLSDPSATDEARLQGLVGDLVGYLEASAVMRVTCLPVAGLEPTADSTDGEVRVRPLTGDELGRTHGIRIDTISLGDRRPGIWPDQLGGHPTAALELREPVSKTAPEPSRALLSKLILALQLHGFNPNCAALFGSGSAWAYVWREPGALLAPTSYPVRLASQGDERRITGAELVDALKLAKTIPDGAVERPHSASDVGLHRFGLGATRDSKEDSVIDYVIALESVLLTGANQELSFRFRLFGGRYLAAGSESPRAILAELKDLYELRSNLVHGSKFPTPAAVGAAASRSRELAARALLKCLAHGWPTLRGFEDVALG